MNQDAQAKNERFYNHAYSSKFVIKALIKLFFSYDQLSKTRRNLRAIEDHIESLPTARVLDYGFGHGSFLMRMPKNFQLYGCELSSEAIDNLSRLGRIFHREVSLFNPERLSSNNVKFDLICCSHVLEHVDDDVDLLNLFYQKLTDDGRLLLNLPINEVWGDPNHVRSYSLESARNLVEKVGFRVEKVSEEDKWTGLILYHEQVARNRLKILYKILRFVLALIPPYLLDSLESVLLKKYQYQQLVLVAVKQTR